MKLAERTRGDLLILMAALIWGIAFYFQKVAMTDVGPLLFIGLRGLVAALVLSPFALAEQRRRKSTVELPGAQECSVGSVVPVALLAGLIFFIAGSVQQLGLVTATVTNTGFLTALYVVVTPFLFWIIRRQPPERITWISVVLAFLGIWGLSGGSISALSRGDVLVACSSLFWASLLVVAGQAARHAQPWSYTCILFAVVAILGLVSAFIFETVLLADIWRAIVPVLYVGVLSSALTFGVTAVAMQYVSAPRASILLSMETVFAAMAGYAFLGERLSLIGWTGAAMILSAVVLLNLSKE